MNNEREYWMCVIGPTTRDKLPMGADSPLRNAVQRAYEKMLHSIDYDCSSGWGMTQRRYDIINRISTTDESKLEEIELILKRRENENK